MITVKCSLATKKMKSELIVASSDKINKKGFCFALCALEGTVHDNCEFGAPQLIAHDQHRHVGQTIPLGLYIQPNLARQISKNLMASEENDFNYLQAIRQKFIESNLESNYFQSKTKILRQKLSSILEDGIEFKNHKSSFGQDKGILYKLYPYLKELRDKDGLIHLKELLQNFGYIGNGALKHKIDGFIIFCNSYFRRSLSRRNNFHTTFLDKFFSLKDETDITLRIALDEDIVSHEEIHNEYVELDYWFGPTYTDNIEQIPNGITRYESNSDQKFFSQVTGMDFWWKSEKDLNLKTLEAEEIREEPSLGVNNSSYGCRYVHSIYDISKSKFEHFDGAIRMYDEEEIMKRWDTNINKAGKNTIYTKLFRIDGKLPLEDWKLLTTLYYHGNPLIYEYFNAEKPDSSAASNVSAYIEDDKEKDVPKITDIPKGINVYFTYRPVTATLNKNHKRSIHFTPAIEYRGDSLRVLEYDILEIKKVLQRMGENLEIPNDVKYVKPYDLYTNYPTIYHYGDNVSKSLQETTKAYLTIFKLQSEVMQKHVSFGYAWEMEDKLITMSLYGEISEVVKYLENVPSPPTEREKFRIWMGEMYEWLSQNYPEQQYDGIHRIEEDGRQVIKRDFEHGKLIENVKLVETGLKFDININEMNDDFKIDFENGRIAPVQMILLNEIVCKKTGEDYFTSCRSKYLDDTAMMITKCELLGFFWTDKPLT